MMMLLDYSAFHMHDIVLILMDYKLIAKVTFVQKNG